MKSIIFDVDGVLIEADDEVRHEKYRRLFEWGMELIDAPDYGGSSWMFSKLKQKYDDGVEIDPHFYRLINPQTPDILGKLSERFDLFACSLACESITLAKLKATGIDTFFKGIYRKPIKLDDKTIAVVEDRVIDYGNCFFIKFNHGQYGNQVAKADLVITNLGELLSL